MRTFFSPAAVRELHAARHTSSETTLRKGEGNVLRGLEPPAPVLLQTVLDDVVEGRRDVLARLRQLGRLVPHDRGDRVAGRVSLEGPLPDSISYRIVPSEKMSER